MFVKAYVLILKRRAWAENSRHSEKHLCAPLRLEIKWLLEGGSPAGTRRKVSGSQVDVFKSSHCKPLKHLSGIAFLPKILSLQI